MRRRREGTEQVGSDLRRRRRRARAARLSRSPGGRRGKSIRWNGINAEHSACRKSYASDIRKEDVCSLQGRQTEQLEKEGLTPMSGFFHGRPIQFSSY